MLGYVWTMQITLRKMGNSTGLILPKALLKAVGAGAGTAMDIRLEDGSFVVTPHRHPRDGWAEAAALIGTEALTEEEQDWMGFGNDGDDELRW